MRLGVLGGFLSGTVLSGLVLGTVSVLTGTPGGAPPQAVGLEVPAGSKFNQSREDTQARLPAADATPEAEALPRVAAPEPDDLSSLEGADTEPAALPEAGRAESRLRAPAAQDASTAMTVGSDEPVLPSPQALAPEAPDDESGLAISTEPAQPVLPEDGSGPAISTEPAQPVLPEIEQDSGIFRDAAPPADADAQDASMTDVAPPEGETAAAKAPVQEPTQAAVAVTPAAPEGDAQPDAQPDAEVEAEGEAEPESEPEPEPSGTIGNLVEGVTTGRLPAVVDAPTKAQAEPPPLERFAAPFSNPEGKPIMAIVLIDDGSSPISHEALADFPYPISYAIDANWPGAVEAARKYRAAGLEVLALADLPQDASARDTEVAMQAWLAAVPGAVAVMEGTGTGLQSSREATEQLIPILRDSGHGLVLFSSGLDTARKLIAREGLPVAPVFRDFDSQGQQARAIRRFLDRAAFKASQDAGGVIMVGRLRAETVSALLLWGLQDRAASVALAPVSAILRAPQE